MQTKYKIYELSARSVISFADETDGVYHFHLSKTATQKCMVSGASHEQNDNALFYQIMCVLHGDSFETPRADQFIHDLSDIIFYMNFEHIFDRNGQQKKYGVRQRKARDMFHPEGIELDFGNGVHRYLAFERSASMSRNAHLSFIRADFYEAVRRRIMMDISVGRCQLSKLYAYNGLMLSGGTRVEGVDIDRPHRVIVIDNAVQIVPQTMIVTVADDGTQNSTRRYHREESTEDIKVLCFDGEGLISKEYAGSVDHAYCGRAVHTSFQIRLPFVKGMLHQVDFKDFLANAGTTTITDIWGDVHNVADVDIILTRSMFKGYGWLTGDGKSWADYWDAFRRYRHALYITGTSKEKPEETTELNYQFLNTLSLIDYDFRPDDLPDGWERSPRENGDRWLTKQTELAYYNFCANAQFRLDYFQKRLESRQEDDSEQNRNRYLAAILKKNPLFITEPVYAKELEDKAEEILKQYSIGHLIVSGDNRYLSDDLLELLHSLVDYTTFKTRDQTMFALRTKNHTFLNNECYAPGSVYENDNEQENLCTILRNPHISRNEEVQGFLYYQNDEIRERYLGSLTDVIMVSARGLFAEHLGGADFDGDMVKTITDPIVCDSVGRNTMRATLNGVVLESYITPLLHIPTVEPQIRDADDWEARFETISSTFSSRVGQICNAALDRSVIAYNENTSASDRMRYQEETETLAILTGLEIDSAKSGVRPDLSEYLGGRKVPRSTFLTYKTLVEEGDEKHAWYEPSKRQKIEKFFKKVNWDAMDSNLERLPYLARQLKKYTPRIKDKPAADSELFTFAQDANWKERLDTDILDAVDALLKDYEACLSRIRACRAPVEEKRRESDLIRILYSRGQEDEVDTDELYALFQTISPERISALRQAIIERKWYFMNETEREAFLLEWLPEQEFVEWYDLFSDFRSHGFKLLGDFVCDVDDENILHGRKALYRETDSPAFTAMMNAYVSKTFSQYYRDVVAEACRAQLDKIVEPVSAVRYVTALGKRKLLFDLLLDALEENVMEVRHD